MKPLLYSRTWSKQKRKYSPSRHAADRRAMGAGLLAAVPLAARRARLQLRLLGRGGCESSRNIWSTASSATSYGRVRTGDTRIDISREIVPTALNRWIEYRGGAFVATAAICGAEESAMSHTVTRSKRSCSGRFAPERLVGHQREPPARRPSSFGVRPSRGLRRHGRDAFPRAHRVAGLRRHEPHRAPPRRQRPARR